MKKRGADRQVRNARVVGLAFIVAGFVAIGLAWNGMARFACVDCQMPYVVSGGIGGMALVLLGVGLVVMAQFRDERRTLAEQLEHAVAGLAASTGQAVGPTGSTEGQVVAGRATYHKPDCRLVKGKSDLSYITVAVARSEGLSPCRICTPPAE